MGATSLIQGFVEYLLRMTWSKRDAAFGRILISCFHVNGEIIIPNYSPNQNALRLKSVRNPESSDTARKTRRTFRNTFKVQPVVEEEIVASQKQQTPPLRRFTTVEILEKSDALENYRMDVVICETFVEFVAIVLAGFIKFFYEDVALLHLFGYQPGEDVKMEQTVIFILFSTGSEMGSLIVYICHEGCESLEKRLKELKAQSWRTIIIGLCVDFGIVALGLALFQQAFMMRHQVVECPYEWQEYDKNLRIFDLCHETCTSIQDANIMIKAECDARRAS